MQHHAVASDHQAQCDCTLGEYDRERHARDACNEGAPQQQEALSINQQAQEVDSTDVCKQDEAARCSLHC